MANPYTIKRDGVFTGKNEFQFLRALAQTVLRQQIKGVAALTNNAGGTAATSLVRANEALVNNAVSGSNLADKTTTEADYQLVVDALAEIYAKANALAALVGVPTVTNNGGGATPDGVIAAIGVSPNGATTGVQAASINALHVAIDNSMYRAGILINALANSVRVPTPIVIASSFKGVMTNTIAAIPVTGAAAAAPGVLLTDIQTNLTLLRSNVDYLVNGIAAVQAATSSLIAVAQ